MRSLFVLFLLSACHNTSSHGESDAPPAIDAAPDATMVTSNPLGLSCAVTTAAFTPAECPPPPGTAGQATFCYRPQWPGVTSVDVLGGFGQAGDWTTPFASLVDRGDGTWSVSVPLTGGPYPYIFRVKGAGDGVAPKLGLFTIDQTNPSFVPAPAASPYQRSVSQLALPQVAAPIHHLHGSVVLSGMAQPCFVAQIDVGELLKPGGGVVSEHGVANLVEIGADGTFDVPVADGPVLINVKYPFGLSASYPDPAMTPSVGIARTSTMIAGADATLDPTDVTYPTAAYAAMTPAGGTSATAPIAFAWALAPGASGSYMSITATDIAGNDPAYTSGTIGAATSATWDGKLNNGVAAAPGTYYWATWQKRGIWMSESLELAITLQ